MTSTMRSVRIDNFTQAYMYGKTWLVGQNCGVFDERTKQVHVYTCIRAHYSSADTSPIPQSNSSYWQYVGRG